MKIFISYRRADSKYVVDRIRDRLIDAYGEGAVFRDIESIPLGRNFSDVLNEATSTCNIMLVVIGPQWAGITDVQGNKRLFDPGDYTRIEIETGLAHKEILVIPVLVMNSTMPATTDIPESLQNLRFRNAISVRNDPDFNPDMLRLVQGINDFLGSSPISVQYFEPETIHIPKGPFWMGFDEGKGIEPYDTPRHEVHLPDYRIGKYPVTNSQYYEFVLHGGQVNPEMNWEGRRVRNGFEDTPVMGVKFDDARKYCEWLSEATGREYKLPNEAQLEKAYQGSYGCSDVVDNVYQWTCTLWGAKGNAPDKNYRYPWKDDGRNNMNANSVTRRVVCVYPKQDAADALGVRQRSGQFPLDVGFSDALHSFRVVMIV